MSWLWAEQVSNNTAWLDRQDLAHARKVLRKKSGAAIQLVDGRGQKITGQLLADDTVQVESIEQFNPPKYTLIFGLGSRDSNEQTLRRAAELGAKAVWPVYCARSRDAGAPQKIKLERWQAILKSGCKQSGNPWLPDLVPATNWSEALSGIPQGQVAVLSPIATKMFAMGVAKPYLAIGPEGGWENREIEGLDTFQLGPWVMRTPVAATAILSTLAREIR